MTEQHSLRRLYYEEGKNITEIAKETGQDRKRSEAAWKKRIGTKPLPGRRQLVLNFPSWSHSKRI